MRIPPPDLTITSSAEFLRASEQIALLKARRRNDLDQALLEALLRAVERWQASSASRAR